MNLNDFVVVPNKPKSVKLNSRGLQALRAETLQLDHESGAMEQRLQQLRQRMSLEKEERERSGGVRWRSGHGGALSGQTHSTRRNKDSGPQKPAAGGKVKIRLLKDEPLPVASRPTERAVGPEPGGSPCRRLRLRSRLCGQCEAQAASLMCAECREEYCVGCFIRFHQKGALKLHRMIPIQAEVQTTVSSLDVVRSFQKRDGAEEPGPSATVPSATGPRAAAEPRADALNAPPPFPGPHPLNTQVLFEEQREVQADEEADEEGLGACFDEEESARSFQQALRAWRGQTVTDSQQSAQRLVNTPPVSVEAMGTQADLLEQKIQPIRVEFSERGISYMEKLLLKRHRRTPIEEYRLLSRDSEQDSLTQSTCETEEDEHNLTDEEMHFHSYCVSLFAVSATARGDEEVEEYSSLMGSCLNITEIDMTVGDAVTDDPVGEEQRSSPLEVTPETMERLTTELLKPSANPGQLWTSQPLHSLAISRSPESKTLETTPSPPSRARVKNSPLPPSLSRVPSLYPTPLDCQVVPESKLLLDGSALSPRLNPTPPPVLQSLRTGRAFSRRSSKSVRSSLDQSPPLRTSRLQMDEAPSERQPSSRSPATPSPPHPPPTRSPPIQARTRDPSLSFSRSSDFPPDVLDSSSRGIPPSSAGLMVSPHPPLSSLELPSGMPEAASLSSSTHGATADTHHPATHLTGSEITQRSPSSPKPMVSLEIGMSDSDEETSGYSDMALLPSEEDSSDEGMTGREDRRTPPSLSPSAEHVLSFQDLPNPEPGFTESGLFAEPSQALRSIALQQQIQSQQYRSLDGFLTLGVNPSLTLPDRTPAPTPSASLYHAQLLRPGSQQCWKPSSSLRLYADEQLPTPISTGSSTLPANQVACSAPRQRGSGRSTQRSDRALSRPPSQPMSRAALEILEVQSVEQTGAAREEQEEEQGEEADALADLEAELRLMSSEPRNARHLRSGT